MLLSAGVLRCQTVLLRHGSLNGPILRHFRSGRINGLAHLSPEYFAIKHIHQNSLTEQSQFNQLPPDPVGELGAATTNNHYWQQIPFWKDVSEAHFLSYQWQVKKFPSWVKSC